MRDGWTITEEYLTYDGREPTPQDYWADEVEDQPRWVVRQYDTIVRSRLIPSFDRDPRHTYTSTADLLVNASETYLAELAAAGIIVDPHVDWRDYTLHADALHAAWVNAQPETLPILATSVQTAA
jgi:hypothetical protein